MSQPGGEFLRALREKEGISLAAAGNRAQPPIPSSHLSQIETGKVKQPGIDLLAQLAMAYGITIATVLRAYGVEVEPGTDPQAQEAQRIGERILMVDASIRPYITGYAEHCIREQSSASAT